MHSKYVSAMPISREEIGRLFVLTTEIAIKCTIHSCHQTSIKVTFEG